MPDLSEAWPPVAEPVLGRSLPLLRRWACRAEYVAFRMLMAVLLGLGNPVIRGSIRLFSRLAWHFNLLNWKLAVTHLVDAGYSRAEAMRIGRDMVEHFTATFVEGLILRRRLNAATWRKYVRMENREALDEALAGRRGGIFIGCHQGSWELAGVVMGLIGTPLSAIARPLKNPYLDEWLNGGLREGKGQKFVKQTGGIRALLRDLRENRIGVILADQNAGRDGVFVPFFGRPASTWATPAIVALKTGAAVLPFYTYREGPFRYVLGVHRDTPPAPTGRNDEDVRALTAWYTALFERSIRLHPHQWLWAHRRWLSRPGMGRKQVPESTKSV